MKRAPALLLLPALVALPCRLHADDAGTLKWKGACSEVEGFVNTIVDSTRTQCLAVGTEGTHVGKSFLVVSEQPVFAAPTARKAWVLAVVGAVGEVVNEHPSLDCKAIVMSDVDIAKRKRGYILPCATAKRLQRDIKSDKLPLETAWKQLDASLAEINLQPLPQPK
jgi:hypothetical protein